MNPWNQKNIIDSALREAAAHNFSLSEHFHFSDKICLLSNNSAANGFSESVVLATFSTWEEAVTFFAGWKAHELSVKAVRTKRPKPNASSVGGVSFR